MAFHLNFGLRKASVPPRKTENQNPSSLGSHCLTKHAVQELAEMFGMNKTSGSGLSKKPPSKK
jgi:hypothetical protein